MSAHKCEGTIWTGYISHKPCGKTAAHEHEGQWFCKTHHPPTIAEKKEAKVALWTANRNAKNQAYKATAATLAEQKRRADCYPDLLAALEICAQFMSIASDWNIDESEINGEMRSTYELIEVVRAAIAQARGTT